MTTQEPLPQAALCYFRSIVSLVSVGGGADDVASGSAMRARSTKEPSTDSIAEGEEGRRQNDEANHGLLSSTCRCFQPKYREAARGTCRLEVVLLHVQVRVQQR